MADNSLLVKLGMDVTGIQQGINRSNQLLLGFQNQLTSFARTIASGMGFYSLGYTIVNTVERMAEFQHSMQAVQAITGATGEEFKKLENNAITMAAAFSANEIAQFELEMAKMGFSTPEVIDMTQAVVNLATATGEDLVKSGEIAGATMRNFGLKASDMTRITDVMSGAINDSSMKLTDFGEAMKYVGPVAQQAGMSLEDLAGWMVVLANNGVKSSMMGTSLRRIITDLGLQGKMTSEGLKEFGTSALSTGGAYAEFGRIAQSVAIIMSHNGEVAAQETERLKEMNGITAQQARIMQDDLTGGWNRFQGAIDAFIQSRENTMGFLEGILRVMTDITNVVAGNGPALAISRLRTDIELFTTNAFDLSTEERKSVFQRLEQQAKDAGVALKTYMDNYDLVKGTLFGGNYNPPGPPSKQDPMNPALFGGKPSAQSAYEMGAKFEPIVGIYKDAAQAIEDYSKQVTDATQAEQKLRNESESFFGEQNKVNESVANFSEETLPNLGGQLYNISFGALAKFKDKTIELGLSVAQIARRVTMIFNQMVVGIAQSIGQAFAGNNSLDKILLSSLGHILIELGTMAITISNVLSAIKLSLETLNPIVAFGAGVAAIALGSYFVSQSASIGSQIGSGGSSGGGGQRFNGGQDVNLSGQFVVRGSDLALVLNKQNYRNGIIGG